MIKFLEELGLLRRKQADGSNEVLGGWREYLGPQKESQATAMNDCTNATRQFISRSVGWGEVKELVFRLGKE